MAFKQPKGKGGVRAATLQARPSGEKQPKASGDSAPKKHKAVALEKIVSTAELEVPKLMIEQVIGQDNATEVVRKASLQKRHVLLVGHPGTGKSLLAQAMAELLPASDLEDVLVYGNPLDENIPKVRVVKSGEGRKILNSERMKAQLPGGNTNLLLIFFIFLSSFLLITYGRQNFGDVITAAMLIGLFVVSAMLIFSAQLGKRGLLSGSVESFKLLIDNADKKKAPFVDASGSRAAALLGDCRHDPLQCLPASSNIIDGVGNVVPIGKLVEKYFDESEEGEKLLVGFDEYVLGGQDSDYKVKPVRVNKVFKRRFRGDLVGFETRSGCYFWVTQNHPLAVLTPDGRIDYIEAGKVNHEYRLVIPEKLPMSQSTELSKEFAVFLADLLADGTLMDRRIDFKLKREFKISQIVADAWGAGLQPRVRTYRGATIISVNNTEFCRRLFAMGVKEGNRKFVPRVLFEQPRDVIAAFLSRVISLDGYVNKQGQFQLVSSNQRYLEQIRSLFFKLGVNPKYGTTIDNGFAKGRFQHELLWNNYNWALEYAQLTVNPFHKANLAPYLGKTSFSKECFDDVVPIGFEKLEELRLKSGLSKGEVNRDYYSLNPSLATTTRLTRGKLQQVVQKFGEKLGGESEVESLSKLAFGEYAFDEITSIARMADFEGFVYNLSTETGNYFVDFVLTHNSGGLGTPAHLRVEPGAVHRANKGVLFIDEIATLSFKTQQELLTAMQEKKYSISGQSEMSSGALVHTEPVPCDFVLVASGNFNDLNKMHPALRSRIRGYGYEVYMEESLPDTPENRLKIVQFVAQEVVKDGKIPHFSGAAAVEIIAEARKRAGRKRRLTLKLRELGGLVRAAGDLALERKHALVELQDLIDAKKLARTLEQQVAQQMIDLRKDYKVFAIKGFEVGKVNGLAVMGEAGLIMPIVAEVAPAASKQEGKIIATGKLGSIAKEAVENVSAVIKRHTGKDTSSFDIHVQFLQTYEGVEGDSASISVATAVISALEEVPVDQSVAFTGSLSVRGEVLPVGGVTHKIGAAIDAGMRKVLVPKANFDDLAAEEWKGKIEVVPVSDIFEVLGHALKSGKKKDALLSEIKKEIEE